MEIYMPQLSKQSKPSVSWECIHLSQESGFRGWVIPGATEGEDRAPKEVVWEKWMGYQLEAMTVRDVIDDWDVGVKVKGVGPERRACEHGERRRIAPLRFLELGGGEGLRRWRGPNARQKVLFLKRIVYAVFAYVMGVPLKEGGEAPAALPLDDAIAKVQEMGSVSQLANTILPKKQSKPSDFEVYSRQRNLLEILSKPSTEWSNT
jgi:hypothetical protein